MRIPLADARPFAHQLLRARLLRLGLAGVAVAATVAALAVSLGSDREEESSLASETGGVLVLDVSTSISRDTHRQIAAVLRRAARSEGRFGLVVYSDTAYEALPPGTPAAELGSFARFFGEDAPSGRFGQPLTPWVRAFTSGTKISTGLDLARDVLRRDRTADASVVLVSDLQDDQNDVGRLTQTLIAFRQAGVPLRVVALSPDPRDRRLFEELLPPGAIDVAPPPGRRSAASVESQAGLSGALIALAALALLALAANELLNGRLAWRPA